MVTKAAFGHFGLSLIKSVLRIGGCAFALRNSDAAIMAWCFLVAEILGILEEVCDRR